MANSCKACDDLRTSSSDFMLNGVTPTVCTSLKNDTGFNPASGHNDCTDLDDANDCLIGNMEDEIEAYDVCDWKEYMKKFVPNVYNVIKAIICAICGLWCNFHALIDALQNTSSFEPAQKFLRSSDAGSSSYWHPTDDGGVIEFDESNSSTNHGSFYAPNDGVAIISYCFAIKMNTDNKEIGFHITGYDSAETVSDDIRVKRANHMGTYLKQGTWGQTTAIKMKKGHYLKLHVKPVYDTNPHSADYRLHQVCITFIPQFKLNINVSGSC